MTIESAEDHKKGMVKYSTPNFVFNTSLSDAEFKIVEAKATELELYVTGLTTATTSAIKGLRLAIQKYGGLKSLTLMHYDREKNSYIAQDYNWLCE